MKSYHKDSICRGQKQVYLHFAAPRLPEAKPKIAKTEIFFYLYKNHSL